MRTSHAQGPEQGSFSAKCEEWYSLVNPCTWVFRSSSSDYSLSRLSHVLPQLRSNLSSSLNPFMGSGLSTRCFFLLLGEIKESINKS